MDTDYPHIVIGAGISGLGAAHFARRHGHSTLVLEAAERIGGCINSHHCANLDGFWIEAGGHTCFNSYGNLLSILDDLDLTRQVMPKEKVGYRLWRDGRRRSILSALHVFEALRALPRMRREPKAGRSVRAYYSRILGQRNYRDLLRHAFQAVICQPADDFPAEALFRRKPRRKDVVKAFTFAQGIATIPQAIAVQPGLEVRAGQRITGIDTIEAGGFVVQLADGEQLRCESLTLAVPPVAATQLLPEAFAEVRAEVAAIEVARLETLAIAVRREDLDLPPTAGLIAVEAPFYSAVARDFLPDDRYRGFAFHFRPDVCDDTEKLALACRALDLDPRHVAASARIDQMLPALRAGHAERVARIDAALAGTRLGLTGNWFIGISMEDALTRSRQESTRLFAAA